MLLKEGSAQAAAGICKRVSANPDPRGARSFPLFVHLPGRALVSAPERAARGWRSGASRYAS